ncbi:MAG: hypothetical protein WKG01_33545 [Kofleriaceae bacterium]
MHLHKLLALVVVLVIGLGGCNNGEFRDCAVACNATSGCPDGLTCNAEGLCRISGANGECGDNPLPDAEPTDADPPGSTRFDFTGEAESYVVPTGITELRLVINGASGGDTGTFVGGFGAMVDTIVTVTPGETLTVIVGEKPVDQVVGMDGCGASGGGGSFVMRTATAPVAVAGGGGGASGYTTVMMDGGDASTTTSGRSSTVTGGSGGSGGSGVVTAGGGGGGGGILSAGGAGELAKGGFSYSNGTDGGLRDSSEMCGTTSIGGFGGGGGGGRDAGAGGGGYSGGAARDSAAGSSMAGGGGSFALGTPAITIRTTHGHGSVVLTPR